MAAIAALSLAATGTFVFLWQSEAASHTRTQDRLTAATKRIASLESANARLEGDLAETKELASRRAAVIAKAEKVLKAVDPLLASVDELQHLTAKMQAGREDYAAASEELKSDLVSLANYLLDVDPYYADRDWVQGMIYEINSEIASVGYYASTLYEYDGDHAAASGRFDTRASGFAMSIRELQKKLREVAE